MGIGEALGELYFVLSIDSSLDDDFAKAEKSIRGFGSNLSAVGGAMTAGVTAPILAAGAAFGVLSSQAISFEKQMNEVFTLLPGITADGMDDMTRSVLDFSKEVGVLPSQVVPALYQALSAGVPEDNVFEFLRTSTEASIGGSTALLTAVDALTNVTNSYGQGVLDVATASDLMFTTVRLGKTTFEELAGSLYNVTPFAAAMGVGFDEISAAMAVMTKSGTPTTVATTQLRQALVDLSKDGGKTAEIFKEISGTTFPEFINSGGSLQEALGMLEQHAAASGGSIADMFGSVEAGSAALMLTGNNAASFADALAQMDEATGATGAAFDTMDAGVARSIRM